MRKCPRRSERHARHAARRGNYHSRVPQRVRAQNGWKQVHGWLIWVGFVALIPALFLAHRAEDLAQLDLGQGRGAALEALVWALPRLALHPPSATPVEVVEAARWYLVSAGCAAAIFISSGLAWLQAQIPTLGEATPEHGGNR